MRVGAEEAARRIGAAVDTMGAELVEFLREIVRIPTENPPGRNYPECAAAIGRKMAAAGLTVETVDVPAELLPTLAPHGAGLPRPSVIGTLAGPAARPLLHFTGHYDVVPAGEGWTLDPYAATVRDGRIFGRGASDQKSGIAAQIFAIKALQRAGLKLRGTIVSSATPDEETGGFAGLGYLVDRGLIARDTTDYCVITECMDPDTICLGHRGTLWLELETRGRQAHGCTPMEGVNAIDKMVDLITAVRAEILPGLDAVSAYPIVPPACRRSTFTVTMLQAGAKVNMVPGSCRAAVDWRLIPEQSVTDALASLVDLCRRRSLADPDFACDVRTTMAVEPTLVPGDTALVKAFQTAGREVLGLAPRFSVSPGSDDQKFVVQRAGIEQCILYGPGPLAAAHQADESQPIDGLLNGTKVMALAAWNLMGAH